MIRIRAFRAIDDEKSCFQFLEGHQRILEIYGVTKITSNNNEWVYSPGTIVIIVESEDGKKIFGGARIQISDGITELPIQKAIGCYDNKIHDLVTKGSSEICGLWNSKEVIGMGIGSIILGRVTAALIGTLPILKTFMLCAPATVKMCSRVGCILVKEVGNNGLFYYPNDDLISTAMVIPDPLILSNANKKERENIFSLREDPHQTKQETGPRGSYEVKYDLTISKIDISSFYLQTLNQ